MRIGVVGPTGADDFAPNILDGLLDLGLDACALGGVCPPIPGRRTEPLLQVARRDRRLGPLIERHVLRKAREAEVAVVITVVSLRPETVSALSREGVRTGLWFPDAVSNLGALWMFDAPYDGIFFKEPTLVDRVRSFSQLPIHYLPEAANPRIHRPVESTVAAGTVAVVGNMHPIRLRLLERLVADDVPLALYGPVPGGGLPPSLAPLHTGRYVRGLDKSAVFHSATAVLNGLHPAEIEGMNCRLFEATCAGGAVVTESRAALGDLFERGTEVLAYDDYEELLAHLRELAADEPRRRQVQEAAHKRAMAEHTYAHRLPLLLEAIT